jgi:hypothetical protein
MTFRIVRFLILGCLISTDLPAQAPSDESSDDYYPPTVESEGYAIPKHPLLPKKHASEPARSTGTNASTTRPASGAKGARKSQ